MIIQRIGDIYNKIERKQLYACRPLWYIFSAIFYDEDIVMNYLGIEYEVRNLPVLDRDFIPFHLWSTAFLKGAERPFSVAVERPGSISVFRSFLRGEEFRQANIRYLERFVKFLLWSVGGFRIWVCGCDEEARTLKERYCFGGAREFDAQFMLDVFERDLEVCIVDEADFPEANEQPIPIGGHLDGCRIGFDAGGSDRKVSAVIDGETVYSEEVVWNPKLSEDPQYQFDGIVSSFRTAASKMPRVDAIGVSSAGVFVGNAPMVSSLFIKVPRSRREEVKTIFDRAAKEIGDVPITVANDGDVTALAGAMSLGSGSVLGISMGTSEAGGYINPDGNILGWFNELAFAPVDLYDNAERDEWSGDVGVGCKYLSQDAVIKLAPKAGISFTDGMTPAEKLRQVQQLAESGHPGARDIFLSIGAYLAHTVALYAEFYQIRYMLVLGRVASGTGGELLIAECGRVLKEEYPELSDIKVMLPDEKARRVGQSVAAAGLPDTSR